MDLCATMRHRRCNCRLVAAGRQKDSTGQPAWLPLTGLHHPIGLCAAPPARRSLHERADAAVGNYQLRELRGVLCDLAHERGGVLAHEVVGELSRRAAGAVRGSCPSIPSVWPGVEGLGVRTLRCTRGVDT
jgi:hypothetical protein